MKVVRIVQLLLVLALIGYLIILHDMNPYSIRLPFFIPLPTALVLTTAIIVSFLVGWSASLGRMWRLSRENRKLERRLIKLGEDPETLAMSERTDSKGKGDKKTRSGDPERV